MTAFVYCWTDHKTNKLYIGAHKGSKDDGYVCSSKLMMEHYNQRPEDFTRQIIAEGDNYQDMLTLEQKILESVDARRNPEYYNMHNGNGDFYCKGHTKESRQKIGVFFKGVPRTEEVRQKISIGNTGKIKSEKTRQKLSKANKGKKRSSEIKLKISERQKGSKNHFYGKKHTEESVKLISANHYDVSGPNNPMYNKTHSTESRIKISNACKGKNLGKKKTEETKRKMAAAKKLYWANKKENLKCL